MSNGMSRGKRKSAEHEAILTNTYFTRPTAQPYLADYGKF